MSDSKNLVSVGAICLLLGGSIGYLATQSMVQPVSTPSASSVDRNTVVEIVKDTIKNNPEMIVESLQNMQKTAYEKQMAKASEALKENMGALKASKNSPFAGPEDAPVTVVEFFDYNCGYCKRMTPVISEVLQKHKDVKVVFKEFPILSEASQLAARASLAMFKLKPAKYFEYHTALAEHKGAYTQDSLAKAAKKFGISADQLEKEMQSDWIVKELEDVSSLARSLNIQGTPAIIVGEELIPGATDYKSLEFRIKTARAMAEEKK